MSYTGLYTLGFDLDPDDRIWAVGQDLRMFNGATWTYYNYQNSAVPSVAPYYLDTRTISIAPDGTKWVGCAEVDALDNPAIFYIDPDDVNQGRSWTFNQIDTFETPMEVSKIYACPYGNDVLAFLNPLGTSDVTFSGSFDTVYYWGKIASIGTTGDVVASTFVDVNTGVAVANNEIWTTSNGGVTWNQGPTASTSGDYFTDVVSYTTSVFALTAFGNYFISSDGGATWAAEAAITGYSVGTNGITTSASFRDATNSLMVLSTEDSTPVTYRSYTADGGSTWTIDYVPGSGTHLALKIRYSISTQSALIIQRISDGLYIFAQSNSADFGFYGSFTSTTGYTLPYNDVLRLGTTYIAVGNGGRIISSFNSGVTWAVRDSGTTEDLLTIDVDPTDSTKFYITGTNGTILKSIDSTQTWFSDLKSGSVDENLNSLNILGGATGYTIGGSGSVYSEVSYSGLTGGFLYRYDIPNDSWKRVADGYAWPHVYDIKARGFGGNDYRYYLATIQGIIEIPGEELGVSYLDGGIAYIPSANFYNSSNFSNLSDNIYSLGFDENFNLWSGSDEGKLQFWDFQKWQTFDTPGATASVTSLVVRENGHVFWGNYDIGPGLYHFNGVTGSKITLTGSNQILSLGIQKRNRNQDGILTYQDDVWTLTDNELSRFSYEIPHIKASGLADGATGWNFTYYTQATGSNRPFPNSIPGTNRYTWEYPFWQSYQTDYLQYKFPGLDPRNLFLTTELSEIASGEAGNQSYWNNPPIPSVEDENLVDSVQESKWTQILSNLSVANVVDFDVYSTCIVDTGSHKRYLLGGAMIGRYEPFNSSVEISPNSNGVILGKDITGATAYLFASNPTLSGSIDVEGGQTYDSSDSPIFTTNCYTGFIVSYDEDGRVVDSMSIPGKSTKVLRIVPSEDGSSIYVGGSFNGLIEVGDYIWSSVAPTIGPTGAPVGLTNSNVPGLETDYDWIYTPGGTGEYSPNVGIQWTYRSSSSTNTSDANFRLYGSDGITQVTGTLSESSGVKYISVGQSPASGTFSDLSSDLYTGMVVQIGSAYYRIDTISYYLPDNNFTFPVYCMGVTWVSGSQSLSSGTNYSFDFWYWNQLSFPLFRDGASDPSSVESGSGIFVMELTNNLGNTTSLRDSNSTTAWKYQVKNFRHFPSDVDSPNANIVEQMMVDVSKDTVSFSFQTDYTTPDYQISTLKNAWNRTTDNIYVPDQIGNDGTSSDVNGILVMNSFDFSLRAGAQINNSGADSIFSVSIASLSGTDTLAVNGSTSIDFNIAGVTFTNPTVYSGAKPFYFIMDYSDTSNIGVTGGFFSSFGSTNSNLRPSQRNAGYLSKYNGYYTITNQHYGATSGIYLGKNIELGLPNQYLVTGFINPSNTVEKVIFGPLPDIQTITQTGSGSTSVTDSDLWNSRTIATRTGNLVGVFAGATSASLSLSLQETYVFKQDLQTGVIETLGLDTVRTQSGISYTADLEGNIFFSGNNSSTSGTTGPDWLDYVTTNTNANLYCFLSEQYVPQLGVNMGQIISRPGSNPWTWCDVHQTDRGMEIPQLSTVFFSNYNSAIYGKQNNIWILSNAQTGDEILNVKNTPYFIYTFTDPGYYSIYNSVEDAFGNVFKISKPAFITVVNHREKNPNDKNPFIVNSSDYGWPIPPTTKEDEIQALKKNMAQDQVENLNNNRLPFYSNLIIADSTDATFNQ